MNRPADKKLTPKIIVREKQMVDAMVKIYCQDHHHTSSLLCSTCNELKEYAKGRLDNCRYQEKKPVCGRCGLKCYNAAFKDAAERMFTYAGPRMALRHPMLGLQHILDAFRPNARDDTA